MTNSRRLLLVAVSVCAGAFIASITDIKWYDPFITLAICVPIYLVFKFRERETKKDE